MDIGQTVKNISDMVPSTGKIFAIGTGLSGIGAISNFLSGLLNSSISSITKLFSQLKSDSDAEKLTHDSYMEISNIDVDALRQNLYDKLLDDYFYSEFEVRELIDYICYTIKMKQEDPKRTMKPILIWGDPACGKTRLITTIQKELGAMGVRLDPSMYNVNDKTKDPITNMLGTWTESINGQNIRKYSEFSAAISYMKKGQSLMLLADDVDKYAEILPKFWPFSDGGYQIIAGQRLDVSNVWVLFTANCGVKDMKFKSEGTNECLAMATRVKEFHIKSPRTIDYMVKLTVLINKFNKEHPGFELKYSSKDLYDISKYYFDNMTGMRCLATFLTSIGSIMERELDEGYSSAELGLILDSSGDLSIDSKRRISELEKNKKEEEFGLDTENASLVSQILDEFKNIGDLLDDNSKNLDINSVLNEDDNAVIHLFSRGIRKLPKNANSVTKLKFILKNLDTVKDKLQRMNISQDDVDAISSISSKIEKLIHSDKNNEDSKNNKSYDKANEDKAKESETVENEKEKETETKTESQSKTDTYKNNDKMDVETLNKVMEFLKTNKDYMAKYLDDQKKNPVAVDAALTAALSVNSEKVKVINDKIKEEHKTNSDKENIKTDEKINVDSNKENKVVDKEIKKKNNLKK